MFDATLMFLEDGLMEVAAYGRAVHRIGNRHRFVTPFDVFQTADKDIVLCAGNDHLFDGLCKVLGRPDLITDSRFLTNQTTEPQLLELGRAGAKVVVACRDVTRGMGGDGADASRGAESNRSPFVE